MASEQKCFICETKLSEGAICVVKERGLNTFREFSVKRNDNKISLLKGLASVVVHDACRKRYTNEKYIASFKRKADTNISSHSLRSSGVSFDLKKNCFLCAEEITEEFLKKQKKGN